VNLSADFQRLLPILGVGLVALAVVLLVTRGVGGNSTASAQQVLDRAFQEEPKSAAVDMRVGFTLNAAGKTTKVADTVATGQGADTAPGKPGKENLHYTERFPGRAPVSFDALSTGEQGFIRVDGQWYRLSPEQYGRVFEPDKSQTFVESLGFDPRRWIRDPKVESTNARVGDVEANHIRGDLDADAVLTDLGFYTGANVQSAQAQQFVSILRKAAKSGSVDLYAGKQDGIIRKLSVNARMDASRNAPPVTANLTFAFGLDKVNQPVTVTAPKGALPPARIADIPRAKLGESADDVFGPVSKPDSAGSKAKKPAGQGGGAPKPKHEKAVPKRSASAYLSCVQTAADLAALERCQSALP
jgi:hypothetical protein